VLARAPPQKLAGRELVTMAKAQDGLRGTPIQQRLEPRAFDQLFRKARTHNAWRDEALPPSLIHELYELLKWGPTSANCSPARFVFLVTVAAKARLEPYLASGNRGKTMSAPVCVIVAHDLRFAEKLPNLFPHAPDAPSWFSDPATAEATAFRNGTLQGAYLLLAARSLGLDCGPMSGFDQKGVDREFFAGGSIRSNFLCNIGYGANEALLPRLPRLPLEDACTIL
jgi:3-hydroxypropanoate dehydrogenase